METKAIIKTGGKQYLITPGLKLKIEKLLKEVGDEVVFDEVLLLQKGEQTEIGMPFVKGAVVKAKVIFQGRAKKVTTIKFKPRTRYKKKIGHRQPYTEIEIKSID